MELTTLRPLLLLGSIPFMLLCCFQSEEVYVLVRCEKRILVCNFREVYMEQPLEYVFRGSMSCASSRRKYMVKQSPRAWFDKFNRMIGAIGFWRCYSDHSVFIGRGLSGIVVLVVNIDDILLTRSDICGIERTKEYLKQQFIINDMRKPKNFLGIEMAYGKHEIILSKKICLRLTGGDGTTWLQACENSYKHTFRFFGLRTKSYLRILHNIGDWLVNSCISLYPTRHCFYCRACGSVYSLAQSPLEGITEMFWLT